MATIESVLTKIRSLISRSNTATGRADTDLTAAVGALIEGYGQGGAQPSGSISITSNGTHDVAEYASAVVDVPTSGVSPSGTLSITENGTHDVTNYATAEVNIPGLNARIFDVSVASDKTASVTLITNDWLKSLRNDPNGFVMMRYLGVAASAAMISFWVTANFKFYYSGATGYNSIIGRATASAGHLNSNVNGLPGTNYNGHLNISAAGGLLLIPNATYPLKAGNYQIIAGTLEML